jgi:predicted transcriptional regulator
VLVLISVVGLACWPVCFYWMHRISVRQDALLRELGEQARRIEKLSKAEHELIKDVHPQVHAIKKDVEKVVTATGAR